MASRWAARPPAWLSEALRRDPIVFADVGARGGWQRKWRERRDLVKFVGFEPDSEECQRLRATAEPNEIYIDKALYHSEAKVPLYHCDPPTLTSLYRPDIPAMARIYGERSQIHVTITRVEEIAVTTLDLAIEPLGLGTLDFMKLDTQGSELDILRGSTQALAGPMVGLEVEVEFSPLYEAQPLFPDVSAFLRSQGYEFIDFDSITSSAWMRFTSRGVFGYPGLGAFAANWISLVRAQGGLRGGQRMIYGDAIFMREPRSWLAAVERNGAPRSVALRGLTTACILGYYDHATELCSVVRDAGLITAEESRSINEYISEGSRAWSRAAGDLVRAGRRLAHRLQHLGTGER